MNQRLSDAVAGLSIAGLMLPEAVAYAAIAGLAPQHAIFAGIVGGLAYALVGRSRFAIVAPTSSSAAMLAAAVAGLATQDLPYEILTMAVVAMVGLIFLAAGFLRLGSLSGFIARPVLRGFAFGLAITIIVKQLPALFGLHVKGSNVALLLYDIVRALPALNPVTTVFGLVALAVLLLARRFKSVPGAIIVLVIGVGLTFAINMPAHHVVQVGAIHTALTLPHIPVMTSAKWLHLAELALPLTLIVFAESWGTMRSLALAAGDTVAPDRELKALGAANFVSALVQGMPVGAGFSAGSAAMSAGAKSRLTAVVASLGLAALLLFAGGLVARIPEAVLAAI
ncbi:MAG: SulP family inorganic anion transporter, partial [Alphaproteobacteria bacterium]|nr:SulP family inorganic anion transporter [Alphaproteobacteria bacterium]